MSFSAFRNSSQMFNRGHASMLRQRLYDERDYQDFRPPTLHNPALALLQQSYPSSVCMIQRPLCGLFEPTIGNNYQQPFNGCGGSNNNFYGPAGGWQQIGYLLPAHSEGFGHNNTCTCRFNNGAARRQTTWQRPSRFQSHPIQQTTHEAGCPFNADHQNDGECRNRQCGTRRYHLYMRIDPDRLGQQCLYTSARRGDHRNNNCRYLQFGISEEGVFNSAIIILTNDYIAEGRNFSQRFGTRCIEDGDVIFVPGEQGRRFRVTLYDDRIFDGYCS